jgi:RNA recognition motif-containing protein
MLTGTVVRADVSIGPKGRSRGFGTVTFSNESEAEAAIDIFNNYEWFGRKIEVREDWAVPTDSSPAPEISGKHDSTDRLNHKLKLNDKGASSVANSSNDAPSQVNSRSLYVGNLPYSAQWQEVKVVDICSLDLA